MSLSTPYPLLCKPLLKPKIWGGRNLQTLFGMELPENERIGEAWMVADLPQGASWVGNGPLAGRSFSEAVRLWGEALVGTVWENKTTGGRFPLLVKFIDAQEDLSVQVHPDSAACREHFPSESSKDETWVVLDASPGGSIFHGFLAGTTSGDFERLLALGEVEKCLHRLAVRPGDVVRVAPGTVHALLRGVVILEIQQPSDSTFRLFDYGRLGEDGRPRPLHIESARKVLRFGEESESLLKPAGENRPWGRHEILVDAGSYRIERACPTRDLGWRADPRSAQVLVLVQGAATLAAAGQSLAMGAGSCVVVPACSGEIMLSPERQPCTLIVSGAGEVELLAQSGSDGLVL